MSDNGKLVFVVDSSKAMRETAAQWLRTLGHRFLLLDSGAACLKALKGPLPDMVLMDLQMDAMRGDACCREIKANPDWKNVAVVMTTAVDTPAELMNCWRAGADDFLPKPLDLAGLATKLDALAPVPATAPPPPSVGRVLFVNNSRFFRNMLGSALEHAGFHVVYASSASEALELAKSTDIEVCLADLDLPGGGLALARSLAEVPKLKGKPVCLFSGIEDRPEVAREVLQVTKTPLLDRKSGDLEAIVRQVFKLLHTHVNELRSWQRVPFFSVVELSAGEVNYSGFSYDVSAGGLFVRTLTVLPRGSEVKLKVRLSALKKSTDSTGVVAWANGPFPRKSFSYPVGMGIRWDQVDPVLARDIDQFLTRTPGSPRLTPLPR